MASKKLAVGDKVIFYRDFQTDYHYGTDCVMSYALSDGAILTVEEIDGPCILCVTPDEESDCETSYYYHVDDLKKASNLITRL